MIREERLRTKIVALEALLQENLINSDRWHYEQRLLKVKSQFEAVQSPIAPPIKTSIQLLEEYNLGSDSCRWTEREIQKTGVPAESVVMLMAILQDMQPYLEKIKNSFLLLANANAWLPETRAEKYLIRDQLFELDMEKDSLVSLVELQIYNLNDMEIQNY